MQKYLCYNHKIDSLNIICKESKRFNNYNNNKAVSMSSSQSTFKFKSKGLSVSSNQKVTNSGSLISKKNDSQMYKQQKNDNLIGRYRYPIEENALNRVNAMHASNNYRKATYTQIKNQQDISVDTKKFNQLIEAQKRKSLQVGKLDLKFQLRKEELIKTERQPAKNQFDFKSHLLFNGTSSQKQQPYDAVAQSNSLLHFRNINNKSNNSSNHGVGWFPHSYRASNQLSSSRKTNHNNRIETIIVGLQQEKQHLKQKLIQKGAQKTTEKFQKENQMLQDKLNQMHKQIDYLKNFRDQSNVLKKQNTLLRLSAEQNQKLKRENGALMNRLKEMQSEKYSSNIVTKLTNNQQPKQHKLVKKKTNQQSNQTISEQQNKDIGQLQRQTIRLRQLIAEFQTDSKLLRLKISELNQRNNGLIKQISDLSQMNYQYTNNIKTLEKQILKIKEQLNFQRKAQVNELVIQLQQQKNIAMNFKKQAQTVKANLQKVQHFYQQKLKSYEKIPLQLDLKMKQIEQEKKTLTKNYSRRLTQMQNQLDKFRFVLQRQNSQKQLRVRNTLSQLKINQENFSRLINQRDSMIQDLQKRNQFLQSQLFKFKHDLYQNGNVNNKVIDQDNIITEFINLKKRFHQKVVQYNEEVKSLRESEFQVKKFMDQMNTFKQRQQKIREQIRIKLKALQQEKHSFDSKIRQLTANQKEYQFSIDKLTKDNQFYKSMLSRLEEQQGEMYKKRGESQIAKMQSEIYYLKTKNEQLKTQLISKGKQIETLIDRRLKDRSLSKSQVLSKYESYNYDINQINSALNNYELKSHDFTQILKLKSTECDNLKQKVEQLQYSNRDIRDQLAVANRKIVNSQQNKKYQIQLIKQQKSADKQQYDRKINQLTESLNRKSKENIEKDKFITSFLVGRSQSETQVSKILALLQRSLNNS